MTDNTQVQGSSVVNADLHSLPNDDPAVSQIVDQAVSLNQSFSQPSDDLAADPSLQTVAPPSGKSPLDILEEILEKEKGAQPAAAQEKSPEEIAQYQAQMKAEQEQQIEAQRQRLQQEIQSPEQGKREDLRKQQAQDNAVHSNFDIPQLKHQKVWVEEK